MVRDDRLDVQTALNHGTHFVPCFEHFPAVNPLDEQAFENDLVPVDGRFIR